MRMYDLIYKKRQGAELSADEINYIINGFTAGDIPDYQISSLCMAIVWRGMNDAETSALTQAIASSGDTIDLSRFGSLAVDKHSTGGVGDKTTLVVAPIVASCGGIVAKMSGRGLGHTGGTVDKLESIPGYRTNLTIEEFYAQVEKTGIAVIGQSGNLTPADKKLYALRDVTATVDSMPLIVSSIMGKKLAAGAHSIVLDVKIGSGAFLQSYESGRELAQKMVDIGKACGRNMTALITNMDRPLGYAVGNALEVIEAAETLSGKGSADLTEVCLALASNMISLCLEIPLERAEEEARYALESGKAFDKFREWISSQGGDLSFLNDKSKIFSPACEGLLTAPCDGYISSMDTAGIGLASVLLGAGREKKGDPIDYSAGIVFLKKTGDQVHKGEITAKLYSSDADKIEEAKKRLSKSVRYSSEPPAVQKTILEIIH